MTSNYDAINSAHEIEMTTICNHLLTAPKSVSKSYIIQRFVRTIAQRSDYYAWSLCALTTGQSMHLC